MKQCLKLLPLGWLLSVGCWQSQVELQMEERRKKAETDGISQKFQTEGIIDHVQADDVTDYAKEQFFLDSHKRWAQGDISLDVHTWSCSGIYYCMPDAHFLAPGLDFTAGANCFRFVVTDPKLVSNFGKIYIPAEVNLRVFLLDGSEAWLNSSSNLIFPLKVTRKREVDLEGEAYFTISTETNSNIPKVFTVRSPNFDIKCEEATFLASIRGDSLVLSVYSGEVYIARGIRTKISAGQKVTIRNQKVEYGNVKASKDNPIPPWRDRLYVFPEGSTLKSISAKVSQIFNVQVSFENSAAAEQIIQGALDTKKPIDEFLENIRKGQEIDFRLNDQRDSVFFFKPENIGISNLSLK